MYFPAVQGMRQTIHRIASHDVIQSRDYERMVRTIYTNR